MKRALFLFMLSGCASHAPVLTPVEVEIPVTALCRMTPIAKPDFALAHVGTDDDIAEKTKASLVELLQRRAYETELEAHIAACQ